MQHALMIALALTLLRPPATQTSMPDIRVDPRVELFSIIFHLAGHPEYSKPMVKSYADDVNANFAPFKDHNAIKLARELRRKSGISYDAPMTLAIHLNDATKLEGIVPLDPRPEGVDQRWKPDEMSAFLEAARTFSHDANFEKFFNDHKPLYATATQRMGAALSRDGHIEWFESFFGKRPAAKFHLVLGMLNGGQCYGTHARVGDREELYCILGVWNTDANGEPTFPKQVLPFVVHEFCHSYANPLIDSHLAQLGSAGETLFKKNEPIMRRQAYASGQIVLRESLVRACVVRYRNAIEGPDAAKAEIAQQEKLGFAWISDLSNLLGEYESHRDQYKSLDDFMPRVVSFFQEKAKK